MGTGTWKEHRRPDHRSRWQTGSAGTPLAKIEPDRYQIAVESAEAELKSAESEIKKSEQTLKDALRDFAKTTLYASYQGQISEVNVVPGSVVSAGSPVLTLQMTNPIKVEVELSAKQSRVLRRRRSAPVVYKLPDGIARNTNAIIYNMDASADPSTRTFTMTLLLLNEQFRDKLPDSVDASKVARSEDVWPLRLNHMMGTPASVTLVEESAITRDGEIAFIHVVTNAKLRETLPEIVKVRRQRIVENELRIPFLGNWVFRSISFIGDDSSPEDVDLDLMYVGTLEPIVGTLDNWDGESIVLDNGSQWMLRPGELVDVDLSDSDEGAGFYLPIEAINEDSGQTCLFIVQDGNAKRILVELTQRDDLNTGSLVKVQSDELSEGMSIIVGGVHYLRDGEPVHVVETAMGGR